MRAMKIETGIPPDSRGTAGFLARTDGEPPPERRLAFDDWDLLTRVLTGKRMEILRHVRRNQTASIRALAKALGRDYSNVHADVHALAAAGLLSATKSGLRADYDAIDTRIAIGP